MTQWHPIFGHLLRPVLQEYYDVQTNVPVGDLPREADIILLRRASTKQPHFETLWKHLTRWNILEFKGRSESARISDIDLLVEVGLGIHRRLQEKEKVKMPRAEVSFWYFTNHLGKRFLSDVIELTGELRVVGKGLWRGQVVGRPIWLVSNRDVPIHQETIPVHLVSDEPPTAVRELAEIVAITETSWESFGSWLGTAYPLLWKEIQIMAKKKDKGDIDWNAVWDNVFDEPVKKRVFQAFLEKMDTLPSNQLDDILRRVQLAKKKRAAQSTRKE
jgi:hypothetical protein